jgi:hypothetical protein
MPTDALNFITDGASSVRMKWREPYVTEGINRKMAGVDPRGIYRGFRLNTDPAVLSVKVSADVVKTDHLAVYESDTGFSISLRRTGGDFTVSLAAYPATTVYLAIYVLYATLTTTQAVLRIYTAAEYAIAVEKPDLIVLGQVVVPGAGVIADTSIVAHDRIEPWNQEAPNVKQWHPVISNPTLGYADQSFTVSLVPGAGSQRYNPPGTNWYAQFENDALSVSNLTVNVQNTDVPFVGAKAVTLTAAGVGPNLLEAFGFISAQTIKVQPGDRLRVEFWYRVHQIPTANGTLSAQVIGANDAVPVIAIANFKGGDVVTLTAAGAWIKASTVFEVTGTVKQTLVVSVGFATDITFALAGALLSLGPWQFWVESGLEDGPDNKIFGHSIPVGTLKFRDPRVDGARGWRTVSPDNEAWLLQQQVNTPSITVGQLIDLKPHENAGADIWTSLRSSQFSAGHNLTGKTNADEQEQARFQASYSESRKFTLLFESVVGGGGGNEGKFRIYKRSDTFTQATVLVYGARWDDSALTWVLDPTITAACRLVIGDDWNSNVGYTGWTFQTGEAPLTEAAWIDQGALGAGNSVTDFVAKLQGQVQLGESLAALASAASEAIPRVATFGDTTTQVYTLVQEFNDAAGTAKLRLYQRGGANAGYWITSNARWNHGTSLWNQDDVAITSQAWTLYKGSPVASGFFEQFLQVAGAAPWSDSGWVDVATQLETRISGGLKESRFILGKTSGVSTAAIALRGDQTDAAGARLQLNTSNILKANVPLINALYSKNIPKAWGKIDVVAGVRTLTEGFGVSTTVGETSGDLVITFHNAFLNATYSVLVAGTVSSFPVASSFSWTTTTMRIRAESTTGLIANAAGDTYSVHFAVFGDQ